MPDGRPRATLPHECREIQSLSIAIANEIFYGIMIYMFNKFLDFVKSPEYVHKAYELCEFYDEDFSDDLFFIVHHDLSALFESLED